MLGGGGVLLSWRLLSLQFQHNHGVMWNSLGVYEEGVYTESKSGMLDSMTSGLMTLPIKIMDPAKKTEKKNTQEITRNVIGCIVLRSMCLFLKQYLV